MRGTGNHHIRLVGTKLFVVVRNGDHDVKIFAGSNITEARQTRDDVLRQLGLMKPQQTEYVPLTKKERAERDADKPEEPVRLPRREYDYNVMGCAALLCRVAESFYTRERRRDAIMLRLLRAACSQEGAAAYMDLMEQRDREDAVHE
jgi:hypothetical protein